MAAHSGKVEPDYIKTTHELSELARPPIDNRVFRSTEDYDKWMDAFYEDPDVGVLEEIGQKLVNSIKRFTDVKLVTTL